MLARRAALSLMQIGSLSLLEQLIKASLTLPAAHYRAAFDNPH